MIGLLYFVLRLCHRGILGAMGSWDHLDGGVKRLLLECRPLTIVNRTTAEK
jgi:hypothetical protein